MARLPDNQRLYAIGDIHGRADLLAALFELIGVEERSRGPASSRLVFLGDYIDRGPATHDVIELLIHGLPAGLEADYLMGNHERMFLDAVADEADVPLWLANGGVAMVESYAEAANRRGDSTDGWDRLDEMLPAEHLRFFDALDLTAVYGDYLFVHAGIRPGLPLEQQRPHDLLWIRQPFLDYRGSFGRIVVHGHTPVEAPEVHPNRIAVDTGAVFTGRLTALVLEGGRQEFLST